MSRENIHIKIDELLGLLSIHNSRLSLHAEKISHLDIDVLRKQCIDLYDEVNKLALQGKIRTAKQSVQEAKPVEVEAPLSTPRVEKPIEPKPVEVEKIPEPIVVAVEPTPTAETKPSKQVPKPKVDDEMLSLFEKFSSTSIKSIPKALSVAKRFEFQSAFFDGEAKEYNQFMSSLDNADEREAAFKIYHEYKIKLEWDNEDLKDELKALIYRKYSA
ncbi:hypothetical protein OAD66_08710 [Bacteroidia bacterium]|nr:hypothetical protein [Bacteroidia bacterium]MDB9883197.1 hypothetical protein [Bacteroidia bacterium]